MGHMFSMSRLLLVAVPVMALCMFFVVRTQWGEIAPALPTSSADEESQTPPISTPRTARLEPTVLEPTVLEPETSRDGTSLPPGVQPSDFSPANNDVSEGNAKTKEVIPIPDLQQPAALLEFPE